MQHIHTAALEAFAPLLARRELCAENVLVVVVLSAASALVIAGRIGGDCGHDSGRLGSGSSRAQHGPIHVRPELFAAHTGEQFNLRTEFRGHPLFLPA